MEDNQLMEELVELLTREGLDIHKDAIELNIIKGGVKQHRDNYGSGVEILAVLMWNILRSMRDGIEVDLDHTMYLSYLKDMIREFTPDMMEGVIKTSCKDDALAEAIWCGYLNGDLPSNVAIWHAEDESCGYVREGYRYIKDGDFKYYTRMEWKDASIVIVDELTAEKMMAIGKKNVDVIICNTVDEKVEMDEVTVYVTGDIDSGIHIDLADCLRKDKREEEDGVDVYDVREVVINGNELVVVSNKFTDLHEDIVRILANVGNIKNYKPMEKQKMMKRISRLRGMYCDVFINEDEVSTKRDKKDIVNDINMSIFGGVVGDIGETLHELRKTMGKGDDKRYEWLSSLSEGDKEINSYDTVVAVVKAALDYIDFVKQRLYRA